MEEYKYVVEIQREKGKLSCCILIQDKSIKNYKISVDPTIFITDLVRSLSTEENVIDEDLIDAKVVSLLNNMWKFFGSGTEANLYNIEKLKIAYGIDLDYIICCKRGVKKTKDSSKMFKWVRFAPDFNSGKGLFEVPITHKYTYYGDSMASAILALYHYLVFNGYKPTVCKHCGEAFFTQNLKNTLCGRATPYKYLVFGSEKQYSLKGKTCREAARAIKDRLRKRQKLLYLAYGGNTRTKESVEFLIGSWKYAEAVKKEPSVKNLKAYEEYLYRDNLTKREERLLNQKKKK